MRPDKNATEAHNTQASDSEFVDEKIYPLCPSQKAETAVPEYEQNDREWLAAEIRRVRMAQECVQRGVRYHDTVWK